MKKFLIGAAAIVFAVVATIVSLACVHKKYDFHYANASQIQIFAKSGVAKKHDGSDSFDSSSTVYKDIMKLLDEAMSNSLLKLMFHGKSTSTEVVQDLSGNSPTFSGTTRESNYCIEMQFDEPQNQIVTYNGNTKYVATNGYYGLAFVLGQGKQFGEINVYYKISSSGSYQSNPMKLIIDNSKLVDYIANL